MRRLGQVVIAFVLLCPVAGYGQEIETYLRTDRYSCDSREYRDEWRIVGSFEKGVTVSLFDGLEFLLGDVSQHWVVEPDTLLGPVNLAGGGDRPIFQISEITTERPQIVIHGLTGEPLEDCNAELIAVPSALERVSFMVEYLNADDVSPDAALDWLRAKTLTPPLEMLPAQLERRIATDLAIAEAWFWIRFSEEAKRRAEDPDDQALLEGLTRVWLQRDTSDMRDLLREAIDARARSLQRTGRPVETMRETDPARLCERARTDSGGPLGLTGLLWEEYLELAVGLPLRYWTLTIAEDLLRALDSCEGADHFAEVLEEHWPEIETLARAHQTGRPMELHVYSSAGHTYQLTCIASGYVLTSSYPIARLDWRSAGTAGQVPTVGIETIFLGATCEAGSETIGVGNWCWADQRVQIRLTTASLTFESQAMACPVGQEIEWPSETDAFQNCRC